MTNRFRMADRSFDCIEVCSSRNYSSKYISSISKFGFFVLLTTYSFGSVVYADDARDLFSSVVFCKIIRSFPWFSADSEKFELTTALLSELLVIRLLKLTKAKYTLHYHQFYSLLPYCHTTEGLTEINNTSYL